MEASVPFERPEEYAGKEMIAQQELDAKLEAAKKRQANVLAGNATNRAFRSQENYNSVFSTSDEEPRVLARTSSIIDPPDGLLPPWTPEMVKKWDEREAISKGRGEAGTPADINSGARCIADLSAAKAGAWGLGFGPHAKTIIDGDALGRADRYDTGAKRIIQGPGWIAFLMQEEGEYLRAARRPSGAELEDRQLRRHFARPLGRRHARRRDYEPQVADYPIIPNGGFQAYPGTGETLKVTQRFTRSGPDSLDYRFTVSDPAVYTRPYTVGHDLFNDEDYKVSPDLCHENNRNMGNVLSNARADEATAIENGVLSAKIRAPRIAEIKKRAADAAAGMSTPNKTP